MKAFVITLTGNDDSEAMAKRCIDSIKRTETLLEAKKFDASTPITINEHSKEVFGKKIQWTWPISNVEDGHDFGTGLYKKCYAANDFLRVVACSYSHMRLWKNCVDWDEQICVLEHDAIFTRSFDWTVYDDESWGVLGLNDPRGNTRKGAKFHEMVSKKRGIQKVPSIDDLSGDLPLPMGLAGNSAYLLRPHAAKQLLEKTEKLGVWPNDAIMCKQLFPWLRVTYPYYTTTQRNVSSTTR